MAKEIKFNLIVDGNNIHNIATLQENFNLDDIFIYFQNGLLERWLKVRGFQEKLDKLRIIDKSENRVEIIKKIISTFDIEYSEENIYNFIFTRDREIELNKLSENSLKRDLIISDYHKRYESLKEDIFNNSENISFLKTAFNQIDLNFKNLFSLEVDKLLNKFLIKNILIIIVILLNKSLRKYVLNNNEIKMKISDIPKIQDNLVKDIYSQFKTLKGLDSKKYTINKFTRNSFRKWIRIEDSDVLILQSNAGTKLRDVYDSGEISHTYSKGSIFKGLEFQSFKDSNYVTYIKLSDIKGFVNAISTFRGKTNGYWKDIESNDCDYMILNIGGTSFVRSLGKHGEELSKNGEFPILNGIDYKSNSFSETLFYIKN